MHHFLHNSNFDFFSNLFHYTCVLLWNKESDLKSFKISNWRSILDIVKFFFWFQVRFFFFCNNLRRILTSHNYDKTISTKEWKIFTWVLPKITKRVRRSPQIKTYLGKTKISLAQESIGYTLRLQKNVSLSPQK